MFSITYGPSDRRFHSISFQNFDVLRSPRPMKTPFGTLAPASIQPPPNSPLIDEVLIAQVFERFWFATSARNFRAEEP